MEGEGGGRRRMGGGGRRWRGENEGRRGEEMEGGEGGAELIENCREVKEV